MSQDLGGPQTPPAEDASQAGASGSDELARRRAGLAARRARLPEAQRERLAELLGRTRDVGSAGRVITRRDGSGPAPLSFAQQRLWFLHRLEPESVAYNLPVAFRLRGPLDRAALEGALADVVARHEILRTTFVEGAGEGGAGSPVPRQVVAEPAPVPLPDLHVGTGGDEDGWRPALAEEARRPFDLEAGPLLRCALLRLGVEDHVLSVTFHHIVADGWSLGVFLRDLGLFYAARETGGEADLEPLAIQYADFAAWQRDWLDGTVLAEELAYWRDQLAGAPALTLLPLDRPRTPTADRSGRLLSHTIDGVLTDGLRALARSRGVTLFVPLLAALQVVLARYSGEPDAVVGAPVTGRQWVETEPLVGFFVNTLALRTRLDGAHTMGEVLDRVGEVVMGGQSHQNLPFEKLVEELRVERSLYHTPVFQVMLALQNVPPSRGEAASVSLEEVAVDPGVEKFDLTLSVAEEEDRLVVSLGYATALFDPATVEAFLGHWRSVLTALTGDLQRSPWEIDLLTVEERRSLVAQAEVAAPPAPPASDLASAFARRAAASPGAVALVEGDESWTYGELDARANRLARRLLDEGVGRGELVAVLMHRCRELVVAILGVLKAGAAYLPLDPHHPSERQDFVLSDSGARVLLSDGGLADGLAPDPARRVLDVGPVSEGSGDPGAPAVEVDADQAAYVIYTSGSTGTPKGVVNTHANVLRLFTATEELYAFSQDDVWTLFHSPAFDFSVWELWGALLYGGRLVLVPHWVARSPEAFAKLLRDEAVTVLNQTPSAFVPLAAAVLADAEPPSALSWVIFGGEALDPAALAPWLDRHPERPALVNMYGITETTVHVTHHRVGAEEAASASRRQGSAVGQPLDDLRVHVLDRAGHLVPWGVAGEICVAGPGLARGYLDRPSLTARRFVPDPWSGEPGARLYRSGDLARRRRDGGLEYLGRIDHQVKIRGHRIELGEVEAALRQQPGIADAAVVDREDVRLGRHLVAFFVPVPGASPDVDALRRGLRASLPEYMVPAIWSPLDSLPLTANGKVDRRALPEVAADAVPEGAAAPRRSRTEMEAVLTTVWEAVLGRSAIRPGDNFFDLGGHSLLATQVVARLRDDLGVTLPVRSLFEAASLADLAARAADRVRQRDDLVLPPIEPRPEGVSPPLSSAQQRLWFLEQLNPGTSTYNLPASAELEMDLDRAVLRRSLDEIVRRHEALRTRFVNHKGQPRPVVDPPGRVPLPVVDLRAASRGEAERRLDEILESEALTPFDLEAGPLVRFTLVRLAESHHRLLVTMHHIVSDGWSMGILIRELDTLYRAFEAGGASPLPALRLQYSDYAHWQRQWLRGDDLEPRLDYWRRRLADSSGVLELLTDHPRPRQITSRGETVPIRLSPEVTGRIREFGREASATPFMVLMAAFQAYLARRTGQDDILVGTPTAGRSALDLEGLIGFFVNMVVIRARHGGRPSFRELLAQVREASLGAYTHQDLPFDNVVEALQPTRVAGRNPIFQVILSYQEAVPEEIEMAGVTLSSGGPSGAETKFDLESYFWEGGDRITGSLVYSPELFERQTVERLARQFEELLAAALAAPDRPLVELSLLSEAEERQVREEWNDTSVDYPPVSVAELFRRQVEARPEAVALQGDGQELTYAELGRRSRELAGRLRRHGLGPEVAVGVLLERSVEAIVALLAIAEAGGVYVPLNLEDPDLRTRFILDDSDLTILLSSRDIASDLPEHDLTVLRVEDVDADAGEVELPAVGPDHLLYRMYTSGSTGTPKGVGITHRNVVRLVWDVGYCQLGPDEVMFQFAPLSFDASTFEIWGCLLHGGRLVVHTGPAPTLKELRQQIAKAGVSTLWLTAGLFHQLVAGPLDGLEGVRQLLAGGEALSRSHAEQLFEKLPDCRLINGYGPTETTTFACCHPVRRGRPGEAIPIGHPIANTRVYVVNEALRLLAPGDRGELLIGGDGVGRGYLGRPALTAERFLPDPFATSPGERLYRTGDLVRQRANGDIEFLGRSDDQVKLRGFRIELGEIESVLITHPEVREAAVVVRQEASGDKRLVAYVGSVEGATPDADTLRGYLEGRLPGYMVPGIVVILDALPLTANGKVDRRALPEPDRSLMTAGRELVPPRDDLQKTLVAIWEKVLGVSPIGVTDDFFELGGHSLLMVQLIARIEEEVGRRVPMAELLQGATIERLSTLVTEEADPESFSILVPLQPGGSRPPLYVVHPAGGNLFSYTDLVRRLDDDQPFYGIQAEEKPAFGSVVTVESMAADYLRAIRAHHPDGPYWIGGWSMGGVIAFEMARQLEAADRPPELLAVMDAEAPSGQEAVYTWVVLLGSFALDLGIPMERLYDRWDEVDALPPMGQLKVVLEQAKESGLVAQDMNLAQFRKLFDSFKTNAQMMRRYKGGPYGGRMDLFRAEDHLAYIGKEMPTASLFALEHDTDKEGVDPRDPAKGWGQWVEGGVEIHSIPGNHYTMVREPHVEELAARLLTRIAALRKDA